MSIWQNIIAFFKNLFGKKENQLLPFPPALANGTASLTIHSARNGQGFYDFCGWVQAGCIDPQLNGGNTSLGAQTSFISHSDVVSGNWFSNKYAVVGFVDFLYNTTISRHIVLVMQGPAIMPKDAFKAISFTDRYGTVHTLTSDAANYNLAVAAGVFAGKINTTWSWGSSTTEAPNIAVGSPAYPMFTGVSSDSYTVTFTF